jgi:hypothetical protein
VFNEKEIMKEVSQKEFYDFIGPRDIIINCWPDWKIAKFSFRHGDIVGKAVCDEHGMEDKYYLKKKYINEKKCTTKQPT